ncbi:ankyrin [Calocera viscosa TUFC12733]|uniref:Ankyrin n=1 Tax=Calocera viscosa (strain TUFC12733) TaxID=1330018 RepID=A0A167QZ27_CALVF|nr:ankyrin [Calocera viscosa TUFC12733]
MAVSQPHLPKAFVQEHLKSSMYSKHPSYFSSVFGHELHEIRARVIDQGTPWVINKGKVEVKNIYLPGVVTDHRPVLHIAASAADYLMTCELLRLGADPNVVDESGSTALLVILRTLVQHKDITNGSIGQLMRGQLPDFEERLLRLPAVARILIEHDADINFEGKEGATPLSLACAACDFDLVELLLRHGARPATAFKVTGYFDPLPRLSAGDRSRFRELVEKVKKERGLDATRPPRPCPCFSGKPLLLCHYLGEHAYPPEFLCPCGSQKTHQACCALVDGMTVIEKWVEEDGWGFIGHAMSRAFYCSGSQDPTEIARMLKKFQKLRQEEKCKEPMPGNDDQRKEICDKIMRRLEELCQDGRIDPGFLYAVRRVRFIPMTPNVDMPKAESGKRTEEWNAAIDHYIAHGRNTRLPQELEEQLKIGKDGGAFFRTCDGGCGNKEHIHTPKLKRCSKCKIAVYCSEACQKTDWSKHKKKCGDMSADPQPIPSQVAVENHILRLEMDPQEKRLMLELLLDPRLRLSI